MAIPKSRQTLARPAAGFTACAITVLFVLFLLPLNSPGVTAVEGLRMLAEKGHVCAQCSLGVSYWNGRGVPRDRAQAVQWMLKAAEQEDIRADEIVKRIYGHEQKSRGRIKELESNYRRAAEECRASCQFKLGIIYKTGQGLPSDEAKAAKWFRESLEWSRKAAKQGSEEAQSRLGTAYEKGYGVDQDFTEAAKWYLKAAKGGSAWAQYSLGVMFSDGEGVAQDFKQAVRWFRRAAEQDHAASQYRMGVAYEFGEGVTVDLKQAVEWYQRAAKGGYLPADVKLQKLKKK